MLRITGFLESNAHPYMLESPVVFSKCHMATVQVVNSERHDESQLGELLLSDAKTDVVPAIPRAPINSNYTIVHLVTTYRKSNKKYKC